MHEHFEQLRFDIEHIRQRCDWSAVFGAELHEFELHPCLTESELESFEKTHEVVLPTDYRLFLLLVGDGGAGPYYGLFRLGEVDDGFDFEPWEEGTFVGKLSAPFPHREPWNDLTGAPGDDEYDDEDYERRCDEFDHRYFDSALVDGAIPICHLGCALRQWLVVSGPEAGNVWCDDRADNGGLYPLTAPGKARVSFYEWYRGWLDETLSSLEARPN